MNQANRHYTSMEYTKAIPQYKHALKVDSTNMEAWARLGDCYRLNNQTLNAEACYQKAVSEPSVKNVYKFYYAEMLLNNDKPDEAKDWLESYLKYAPSDSLSASMDSSIKHLHEYYSQKGEYKIERLGINSSDAEFGAVPYRDGIIFTSSRQSESWANREHSWTGKRYYSLYYASGKGANFSAPTVFLKGLQTKYNNSSVCFNKNGNEMILTRNSTDDNSENSILGVTVKLKLFTSKLIHGEWSDVVPFPYNSDKYSCAHSALTPDGSKLYFSSDMPGTMGGMDIWVCNRTDHGWSQPVNLGPSVNTKGNELFPTISDDGMIYFSSNGRGGIGGLDIYSTMEKDGVYSQAVNAGAPINSSDDDFNLIWTNASKKCAYVSSNRTHQAYNDDIFYLTKNTVVLNGFVANAQTNEPIERSWIRILEQDSLWNAGISDAGGNFNTSVHANKNYLVIAENPDFIPDTVMLTAANVNPEMDTVFVRLSLRPRNTIISLEGKVFAETTQQPIGLTPIILINEKCHDTLSTITDAQGNYRFKKIEAGCRYKIVAASEFCLSQSIDTSTFDITSNTKMVVDMPMYCLSDNFVLHNIYYDLDKYNIRSDAAKELDKLVTLLKKFPELKIELSAHTDCRGSSAYNLSLSQHRANSAVMYLVNHGINHAFLKAKGYGESKLINHCECEEGMISECSEEEHQINRRTEIKVLSWNWSIASTK